MIATYKAQPLAVGQSPFLLGKLVEMEEEKTFREAKNKQLDYEQKIVEKREKNPSWMTSASKTWQETVPIWTKPRVFDSVQTSMLENTASFVGQGLCCKLPKDPPRKSLARDLQHQLAEGAENQAQRTSFGTLSTSGGSSGRDRLHEEFQGLARLASKISQESVILFGQNQAQNLARNPQKFCSFQAYTSSSVAQGLSSDVAENPQMKKGRQQKQQKRLTHHFQLNQSQIVVSFQSYLEIASDSRVAEWLEDTFQRINQMKDRYLHHICRLLSNYAGKSKQGMPEPEQIRRLSIKSTLEGFLRFLLVTKSNLIPLSKEILDEHEMSMARLITEEVETRGGASQRKRSQAFEVDSTATSSSKRPKLEAH